MSETMISSIWGKVTSLFVVAALYWFCIAQLAFAGSMGQRRFPEGICASAVLKC